MISKDYDDIPITIVIPAFIISELRAAFIIGFLIYLPFISNRYGCCLDTYVNGYDDAPTNNDFVRHLKLLLFVMADGWNLIIGNLIVNI